MARGAVRRIRRVGWVAAAVGVLALAALIAASVIQSARVSALREHGLRVDANVVAVHGLGSGGRIDVAYRAGGASHEGPVYLDSSSPHYRVGEAVTAYVDRSNPDRFMVGPGDDEGPAFVTAMVVLLLLAVAALLSAGIAWWQARRTRRRARDGFVAMTWSTYVGSADPRRRGLIGELAAADNASTPPTKALLIDSVARLRKAGVRFRTPVAVAGLGGRRLLVVPVGSSVMLHARVRPAGWNASAALRPETRQEGSNTRGWAGAAFEPGRQASPQDTTHLPIGVALATGRPGQRFGAPIMFAASLGWVGVLTYAGWEAWHSSQALWTAAAIGYVGLGVALLQAAGALALVRSRIAVGPGWVARREAFGGWRQVSIDATTIVRAAGASRRAVVPSSVRVTTAGLAGYADSSYAGYAPDPGGYPTSSPASSRPSNPAGDPTAGSSGYTADPGGYPTSSPAGSRASNPAGYPAAGSSGYPTDPGGYTSGPASSRPSNPAGYPAAGSSGYPTDPGGHPASSPAGSRPSNPASYPAASSGGYPTAPTCYTSSGGAGDAPSDPNGYAPEGPGDYPAAGEAGYAPDPGGCASSPTDYAAEASTSYPAPSRGRHAHSDPAGYPTRAGSPTQAAYPTKAGYPTPAGYPTVVAARGRDTNQATEEPSVTLPLGWLDAEGRQALAQQLARAQVDADARTLLGLPPAADPKSPYASGPAVPPPPTQAEVRAATRLPRWLRVAGSAYLVTGVVVLILVRVLPTVGWWPSSFSEADHLHPRPLTHATTPLPALLSLPTQPTRLSQRSAAAVIRTLWTLRDRALGDLDVDQVRRLDEPASELLAADLALAREGHVGTALPADLAPHPVDRALGMAAVGQGQAHGHGHGHGQRFPLTLLGEVWLRPPGTATGSGGQPTSPAATTTHPEVHLLVAVKDGPKAPWRLAFDTSFVALDPGGAYFPTRHGALDPALPPAEVGATIAAYWQHWVDEGTAPPSTPLEPGPWTTGFGPSFARRGTVYNHGLNYQDETFHPRWQTWVFPGLWGDGSQPLVCTTVVEQIRDVAVGGQHLRQDVNRSNWDPLLAPGNYSEIRVEEARPTCVQEAPGPQLVMYGGDSRELSSSGTP